MFGIGIGEGFGLFSKFFTAEDGENALASLGEHLSAKRVVFVDTCATPVLAEVIGTLVARGVEVHVRDHHRGEGRTPEAVEAIEAVLGKRAHIVARKEAPACALLLRHGEFRGPGTVIVADPDLDGLTAAMKAAGVAYEGMDQDAEIFDVRPRQSAETLTPFGWVLVRALSSLPLFDPDRPGDSDRAKADFFYGIVRAVMGDSIERRELEDRARHYDACVAESRRMLKEHMDKPLPGVCFVDTMGAAPFDFTTLTQGMEQAGAVVTAVRKDSGPIARLHGGVQYSLAVVQRHQRELDLRTLVPAGTPIGLEAGLISNTPFLLHCSSEVWMQTIFYALAMRLR